MTKRTDIHRPGALIPARYDLWLDYSMTAMDSGFPIPPIGIDCTQPVMVYDKAGRKTEYHYPDCPDTGRCCVRSAERHAKNEGYAVFGATGKCGVCGAVYVYGSLFKHESGELVHMGHDCAEKYSMMQDASAWELENNRVRSALATAIHREVNQKVRQSFLDDHAGLEEAFKMGSDQPGATKAQQIVADIHGKFIRFLSISDKQIALVMRLADEIRNPKPEVVEVNCPAPEGKGVEFEGVIVSAKVSESMYGTSFRMTVKVTNEAGEVWLANGTIPSHIVDTTGSEPINVLRGRRVEVKATLQRADSAHFAFMKRPSARLSDVYDHPVQKVKKTKKPKIEEPEPATLDL